MRKLILAAVSLFTISVMAQKQEFAGGLQWELKGDVLTISGRGRIPDYTKPWEQNKNSIRKVVIENGITYIGTYAFYECKNLETVQIPNTVTSMGDAFTGCSKLTSIVLPPSLVYFSGSGIAFYRCRSLTSITLRADISQRQRSQGQDSDISTLYRYFDSPIQGRLFIVESGQQSGLKDDKDNWIIPLSNKYSYMEPFGEKYLRVSNSRKWGVIDMSGKEIVPPELDAIEECGTGFLRFKINGYWGVMNYMGKIIIPTERGYTKIGNYVSFTKRFPYEMDGFKGECNNLGVQVSKIKTPSQKQVDTSKTSSNSTSSSKSQMSSSSKSNSSSSSSNTQKVVVEHHHDPVPVQQWQACIGCGGMGTMGCDFCGGSGTKYIGDRLHRCSRCNGRGIIPCNVCYGNKGQYITVYR